VFTVLSSSQSSSAASSHRHHFQPEAEEIPTPYRPLGHRPSLLDQRRGEGLLFVDHSGRFSILICYTDTKRICVYCTYTLPQSSGAKLLETGEDNENMTMRKVQDTPTCNKERIYYIAHLYSLIVPWGPIATDKIP
jgi:hypothetical protein